MIRTALMAAIAIALTGCASYEDAARKYNKFYDAISIGSGDQTVYSASECIGAIVNGACHGTILPNQAMHPVCHGEMLNGMCTGPMF